MAAADGPDGPAWPEFPLDYAPGVGPAIEVEGLVRTYRTTTGTFRRRRIEVEAVRGIDLEVERGSLFGLLGPNGAGKTTTVKVLTTLLLPTAGTARVCGHDVATATQEVRGRIGYVFGGDRGLYDRLSARDNLRYFAELYGVPGTRQRGRIDELLARVGLDGREDERVEGYSRGMRQRLHLARGLLHAPDVLFLDEPSIGVDPVAARELRALVAGLATEGTTILLTTHYMFEADQLCRRIAVIARGRIVAEGTPADLKARVAGERVVEIEAFGAGTAEVGRVRAVPGVLDVALENRDQAQSVIVRSDRDTDVTAAVVDALQPVRLGAIASREPTLEDAYIAIVTSAEREDAR